MAAGVPSASTRPWASRTSTLQPARARFVGLGNYLGMLQQEVFWRSLAVTLA